MPRSHLTKLPFHFAPALVLIAWSGWCALPKPLAGGGFWAALSEVALLLAAEAAVMVALHFLMRWLLSERIGRAAAGFQALLIPLGVLWQQGGLGFLPQADARVFGPWAGLVIGSIAAALAAWLYLLVHARAVRHGAALAVWPLAVFIIAEVGIRDTPLVRTPSLNRVDEKVAWDLDRRTNLFGQFDGAQTITLPHGDIVEITASSGVGRIIALGSSSTFGMGLSNSALAWPAQLAARLPPNQYEVLNAGLGGYNSYQAAVYLKEVLLRLRPQLVIFYYGGNEGYGGSAKVFHRRAQEIIAGVDCSGMSHAKAVNRRQAALRYGTSNRWLILAGANLDRSHLLMGYRNGLLELKRRMLRPDPHDAGRRAELLSRQPPTAVDTLRSMASSLEEIGATLVLTPELLFFPGHHRTAYWDTMAQVAESAPNAHLIDAMPVLEGNSKGRLFLDSSHLSPLGCRVLAEFLAAELTTQGLLPTP